MHSSLKRIRRWSSVNVNHARKDTSRSTRRHRATLHIRRARFTHRCQPVPPSNLVVPLAACPVATSGPSWQPHNICRCEGAPETKSSWVLLASGALRHRAPGDIRTRQQSSAAMDIKAICCLNLSSDKSAIDPAATKCCAKVFNTTHDWDSGWWCCSMIVARMGLAEYLSTSCKPILPRSSR